MIHLLYSTLIFCGALGATLSTTSNSSLIKKKRQHKGLLRIDKEVI